jgi:ubiquinone/menaquinone biosynthesis C-methylase UbiE
MPRLSEPNYLLTNQYPNADNLQTRIGLHKKFSINTTGWFPWMFDYFNLPTTSKLLELGCGPGDLWLENMARIPAGCQLSLSDFSPGMLEQARQHLHNQPHGFTFARIDAQSIPHKDDEFEVVIANHMLYHIPDRVRALSEIRRVLKPCGHLYASTVGEEHMRELPILLEKFDPVLSIDFENTILEFTLQNGRSQLEACFSNVTVQRYNDELLITEASPLADYVLSGSGLGVKPAVRDALIEFLEDEMEQNHGILRITKDSGFFIAS